MKINTFLASLVNRQRVEEPMAQSDPPVAAPIPPHVETEIEYPQLEPKHFLDAGFYPDRLDMLRALAPGPGGVIGEVGVGLGGFSNALIGHLKPDCFVGIDTFLLHTLPAFWGQPTEIVFGGLTHRAFYENFLATLGAPCRVLEGYSHECLADLPENYFDVLYIDADHTFEAVSRDIAAALPRMKDSGILVFNDYVMVEHVSREPYGVIPAVNRLVAESDWRVAGFSLQKHMYCDIALKRAGDRG